MKKAYRNRDYQAVRKKLIGLPCVRCGAPSDTADHIKPHSKGGSPVQLQPMCRSCKSSKGDRELTKESARFDA